VEVAFGVYRYDGPRTADFVGALLRPPVPGGRGVFRFGRAVTVEEHHEHDDEHHGYGRHGHGEYPHEPLHQLVVLQLQRGPSRLFRRRSVAGCRFPRRGHVAVGSRRAVRLVRRRGFPRRRRLDAYGRTRHPESRGARTVRRRPVVVRLIISAIVAVVGFADGAVAAASDRVPRGQSTRAAAAENRRSGGSRLAAPGAVVAVGAHLVADVRAP